VRLHAVPTCGQQLTISLWSVTLRITWRCLLCCLLVCRRPGAAAAEMVSYVEEQRQELPARRLMYEQVRPLHRVSLAWCPNWLHTGSGMFWQSWFEIFPGVLCSACTSRYGHCCSKLARLHICYDNSLLVCWLVSLMCCALLCGVCALCCQSHVEAMQAVHRQPVTAVLLSCCSRKAKELGETSVSAVICGICAQDLSSLGTWRVSGIHKR
jgi:hypothetical protein